MGFDHVTNCITKGNHSVNFVRAPFYMWEMWKWVSHLFRCEDFRMKMTSFTHGFHGCINELKPMWWCNHYARKSFTYVNDCKRIDPLFWIWIINVCNCQPFICRSMIEGLSVPLWRSSKNIFLKFRVNKLWATHLYMNQPYGSPLFFRLLLYIFSAMILSSSLFI